MPTEYAYPEQFSAVMITQRIMLVVVVSLFLVPMIRELLRRGPMNWIDVILATIGLVLCTTLPRAVEQPLIASLQSVHKLEISAIWRILPAYQWATVGTFAGFAIGVYLCWLLTWWVKQNRVLKTTMIYAVPMFWLSLPTLSHPLAARDWTQCRNNAKQIGLAIHNYHDQGNGFPPSVLDTTGVLRSWRVELLPYLDHAPLRNRYDVTAAWDAPPNGVLAEQKVEPLICPGNYRPRDAARRYFTAYAGVIGPHTFFAEDGSIRTFKDVTDGTSHTIAIVEACGANIVWTEPRDLLLSALKLGVNLPGPQPGTSRGVISSCHSGGGHVLFADGTVRFVNRSIAPGLLMDLLTANGGEVIPDDNGNEIR